jgi:hypothetical protein
VFDTFPADTYARMTAALKKTGNTAPKSLWRQGSSSNGRRSKQSGAVA